MIEVEKLESEMLELPMVERRILRACKTLRALPDRERRFQDGPSQNGIWREAVDEWGKSDAEELIRFQPSAFDVGDYLDALVWVRGLAKPAWRLIWWRSLDMSFYAIAERIGRSDETARVRYHEAIAKVHKAALADARAKKREFRGFHKKCLA